MGGRAGRAIRSGRIVIATLETAFLHEQLEDRKRRLQAAIAVA
jgi:hypothetical protein